MKQLDFFGNEVDVTDFTSQPRKTMKEKFREQNGYLFGKHCKNCKYHHRFDYHNKYYHKCEKLGISNSIATDIKAKEMACNLFEEDQG